MSGLVDSCGRHINYLRISVNDRCDLRCTYCMPKQMSFLSRKDVLSFDEMLRLCRIFMERGVNVFRITGGEPLIRRGIGDFIRALGTYRHRAQGPSFDTLAITTNGTLLEKFAPLLKESGVSKVNVSLDTLDPQRYYDITRGGDLKRAKDGILAAREEGLRVRINTVALHGINDHEFNDLLGWCVKIGADFCVIETMPMGGEMVDRLQKFLPVHEVKKALSKFWDLLPQNGESAGPARYLQVARTHTKIGFISPLTQNFCTQCNRVRLSCNGKLYTCLGQDDHVPLGRLLRENKTDAQINAKIDEAIARKPKGHDFVLDRERGTVSGNARYMNMTGG